MKDIKFAFSYQMSTSLVLNDRGKGSFTEPERQVFLFSDDNSTAMICRAVNGKWPKCSAVHNR